MDGDAERNNLKGHLQCHPPECQPDYTRYPDPRGSVTHYAKAQKGFAVLQPF